VGVKNADGEKGDGDADKNHVWHLGFLPDFG
jgi:hypothetical protein